MFIGRAVSEMGEWETMRMHAGRYAARVSQVPQRNLTLIRYLILKWYVNYHFVKLLRLLMTFSSDSRDFNGRESQQFSHLIRLCGWLDAEPLRPERVLRLGRDLRPVREPWRRRHHPLAMGLERIGQSRRRHRRCSRGPSSTAACTAVLRFHS